MFLRAARSTSPAAAHRALFSRLADYCVLCPSRDRIAADHKERRLIDVEGRKVEVWIERTGPGLHHDPTQAIVGNGAAHGASGNGQPHAAEPQIFVLRFNGAGGRAEQTTRHPFDFWTDVPGEVWSPNPPGFGGSEGQPSLKVLAPTAMGVLEALARVAGERPIVITGNSLGTTVALHVAGHYTGSAKLRGLILQNPPPLKELIRSKFGWRTLGLSHFVAHQIPPELDSVANAARVRLPGVFIRSQRDRVVPPRFQQLILEAYGGPTRVVALPDADHVFEFSPAELEENRRAVQWLRSRINPEVPASALSDVDIGTSSHS